MVAIHITGDALWARLERAVVKVRERLERACAALDAAQVPYAVAGGNAVGIWVAQVDEAAVRNTRDVDLLIHRNDMPAATAALEQAGFHYRHAAGLTMFLDGPEATARDAVHVVFAGEKVRPDYSEPAPSVDEFAVIKNFRTLTLEALVRMKLTSHRDKDRTHIRDLIDVGLVDDTWPARFPEELRDRLQALLDTPEG